MLVESKFTPCLEAILSQVYLSLDLIQNCAIKCIKEENSEMLTVILDKYKVKGSELLEFALKKQPEPISILDLLANHPSVEVNVKLLIWACKQGDTYCVKDILKKSTNFDPIKLSYAFGCACKNGSLSIVSSLLQLPKYVFQIIITNI